MRLRAGRPWICASASMNASVLSRDFVTHKTVNSGDCPVGRATLLTHFAFIGSGDRVVGSSDRVGVLVCKSFARQELRKRWYHEKRSREGLPSTAYETLWLSMYRRPIEPKPYSPNRLV